MIRVKEFWENQMRLVDVGIQNNRMPQCRAIAPTKMLEKIRRQERLGIFENGEINLRGIESGADSVLSVSSELLNAEREKARAMLAQNYTSAEDEDFYDDEFEFENADLAEYEGIFDEIDVSTSGLDAHIDYEAAFQDIDATDGDESDESETDDDDYLSELDG